MKVSVKAQSERIYTPDLGNNMDVPEAEQWKIVIRQPSKWRMTQTGLTTELVNGEVRQAFHYQEYLSAFINRFINAPQLAVNSGESTRDMEPSDLFEFDEFSGVVTEIGKIVNELKAGETDTKN